jgi:hypothetical protein
MDTLIIDHNDVPSDPEILMRSIRVIFRESRFNYQTQINGTRKRIGEYFRGAQIDVTRNPDGEEIIRTPWKLEFISDVETDATIVMFL